MDWYGHPGPLRSAKSVSKPCSAPKASRKAKVARVLESTDLGFSRALPKARLTYLLQFDGTVSRDEAIGSGSGPWKEASDPNNGVGGMAKPLNIK